MIDTKKEFRDIQQEIRDRQDKINELRREIEEMRQPYSIKKLMKNEMLDINSRMEIMEHSSCVEAWDHLKRTCMYLFKPRHYGVSMKIKVLTKDEVKVVAQMADEMVEIWNKYIRQEYGNGDTNANG